jgi:CopA family copper-resistance protein
MFCALMSWAARQIVDGRTQETSSSVKELPMRPTRASPLLFATSRRRFVQGLAGGALAIVGARHLKWACAAQPNAVLCGTEFNLEIGALEVNFTGTPRMATVVNGQLPGPLLRWREGDLITLRVSNRLSAPTSIHWHGMIVPADMDGVPGISFDGIAPRETYIYRFRVNQSGTYWYHSHSRFQEQTGLYGPIIIEPRRGERHKVERDHTVLLSDWTDIDPEHINRVLKLKSDYFNFGRRTVGDFLKDAHREGVREAIEDRRMWGKMRMNPTDLADVSGYAYTYLMNGTTPAGNWTALFQGGERVRLRFINGSSMSFFDVRIPGLKLIVVAADGQDVEPVTVDEFRIGTAEVLDVIVEPKDDRAYTIFAQSIDRTGYARGTLAPRPGMQAEVPPLDPRAVLTMADMGMAHEMGGRKGMDHDMANMKGMNHDGMDMGHEMSPPVHHAPAEYGPAVDSLAMQPQSRLNDPGVGLRNNGRRVLTYADLHTLGGPIDHRDASRDLELHLTGHMERFIWSFSGQKFSEAEPLRFNYGERLRLVLVNDSMMNHPIHLHGMWGEVQSEKGDFLLRKHTINIQPGQRLAYWVTADALGHWAYHCHLLYHMEAGMFREVIVERSQQRGEQA